jgi:molybdopterin-guanine dinucleotide biosynthesis protein A
LRSRRAASEGRLHPVCALWPTDAAAELAAYAAVGRASLKGFAAELGHTTVEWSVERGDPFVNANTPEELAALQTS